MLTEIATRAIRRYLVGPEQEFVFRAPDKIRLPQVEKVGLYLHIPFCKNMCPYCPYNKIKYEKRLVSPYLKAVLQEIEKYYSFLGKIKIVSIYIGGGTPTNLIDELGIILEKIKERFVVTGDICIETTPNEINKEAVKNLERYGVNLVSLGVQSFNDKYLELIGRNYKAKILGPAIDLVLSSNFKSVNLDFMFALPNQRVGEVIEDVKKAVSSGADQITFYPLFTFPYSTVGRHLKLKRVKMPNVVIRRKMYRAIHDFCLGNGFKRVSVWGFKRGDGPRYSSVTRDNYIGLGAGAATQLPGIYYFNTFSVKEYIKVASKGELPIAIKMNLTKSLSSYYWLYWRLYDTYIPKKQFFEVFGENNRKLSRIARLFKLFGLYEEDENGVTLNERGAFWIHLVQNYFFLDYVNKVWSVAKEDPWPKEIKI